MSRHQTTSRARATDQGPAPVPGGTAIGGPGAGAVTRSGRRPFHTPVRGHRFQTRPVSSGALDRARLSLRCEPDNPADPYAVAVWADDGGRPWRVGYLERAVAVRVAERLRIGERPAVCFAGWWEEPGGRWHRPVVRVGGDPTTPVGGWRKSLRSMPPCSRISRDDPAPVPPPGR